MRSYSEYQSQKAEPGKGYSPLMLAAYHGQTDLVRDLLHRGDDPNNRDFNGNTVLMGVAFKGHVDVIRLLLQYGANPELKNPKGQTALMFAQMFGRTEAASLLSPGRETGFRDKVRAWMSYLKTNLNSQNGENQNV